MGREAGETVYKQPLNKTPNQWRVIIQIGTGVKQSKYFYAHVPPSREHQGETVLISAARLQR